MRACLTALNADSNSHMQPVLQQSGSVVSWVTLCQCYTVKSVSCNACINVALSGLSLATLVQYHSTHAAQHYVHAVSVLACMPPKQQLSALLGLLQQASEARGAAGAYLSPAEGEG